MRTNAILFWILCAFFGAAAIAYPTWALLYQGYVEYVGTVGLTLTSVFAAFLGFYLGRTQAAVGGRLPEDRVDADIDDGDAEQGFFSPWSWWPFVLALALGIVFLGLAAGVWIIFIGAPLVIIGIIGLQFEYYRGFFAR